MPASAEHDDSSARVRRHFIKAEVHSFDVELSTVVRIF